jgi:A/G-specific adenine glycosylase
MYRALVAEILLQRTRAHQVVPVYREFCARFPSPEHLGGATPAQVLSVIRPLGLAWRAGRLVELGRVLAALGRVPTDRQTLEQLPGVGPYAAGALISFHVGRRATIIDSNVVRLYGRLFGIKTGPETRRTAQFRNLAEWVTPQAAHWDFNYALLDFTREVCTATPKCSGCILLRGCAFGRTTMKGPRIRRLSGR